MEKKQVFLFSTSLTRGILISAQTNFCYSLAATKPFYFQVFGRPTVPRATESLDRQGYCGIGIIYLLFTYCSFLLLAVGPSHRPQLAFASVAKCVELLLSVS